MPDIERSPWYQHIWNRTVQLDSRPANLYRSVWTLHLLLPDKGEFLVTTGRQQVWPQEQHGDGHPGAGRASARGVGECDRRTCVQLLPWGVWGGWDQIFSLLPLSEKNPELTSLWLLAPPCQVGGDCAPGSGPACGEGEAAVACPALPLTSSVLFSSGNSSAEQAWPLLPSALGLHVWKACVLSWFLMTLSCVFARMTRAHSREKPLCNFNILTFSSRACYRSWQTPVFLFWQKLNFSPRTASAHLILALLSHCSPRVWQNHMPWSWPVPSFENHLMYAILMRMLLFIKAITKTGFIETSVLCVF